jgi:transposase InsO family protein
MQRQPFDPEATACKRFNAPQVFVLTSGGPLDSSGDPDERAHPVVNRIFFFAYVYTRRLAARTVQIALAFGVDIDKDVVRRVLMVHYRPESDSGGPSWLTFIGHMKDSLWSCDLFRCESATLRTHWVLVVMDQFTRRVIGFGVHSGIVDGVALCRMFHRAIRGHSLPKYLSSDHDPLYRFHQWQANLRVLEITEIKSVPYVPLSHPFVERLIGTVRREYLDRILFWTTADLETKLLDFQHYYNGQRTHAGLEGRLPEPTVDGSVTPIALDSYQWRRHCRGLYQTPIAA